MPIQFPPGAIHFKSNAPRSPWREFAFILHQIQRAVEPGLSLAGAIVDWPRLARSLSEPSRVYPGLTSQNEWTLKGRVRYGEDWLPVENMHIPIPATPSGLNTFFWLTLG